MDATRSPPCHRFLPDLALVTALLLGAVGVALADDSHDRARQAREAGEILPLSRIIEQVERDTPGRIMDVELEREHGVWLYEIKLLRKDGALVKLKVDARSGQVIGRKTRDSRSLPRESGETD